MISKSLAQLAMHREFVPVLVCIALLIFFACFVGAFFWTYRQASKSMYETLGTLPLEQDNREVKS